MATLPNRYYNSPWIQAAAENLTDALYGNPQRDLAREQAATLEATRMRQAQTDAQEAADRELTDRTMRELSDSLAAVEGPPTPQDYAHFSSIAARVPGTKPTDIMSWMAGYDPRTVGKRLVVGDQQAGMNYRNDQDNQYKQLLQQMIQDGFLDRLGLTLANKLDVQELVNKGKVDVQEKANEGKKDVADIGAKSREKTKRMESPLNRKNYFYIGAAIDDFMKHHPDITLDAWQREAAIRLADEKNLPIDEAIAQALQGGELKPGATHLIGSDDPASVVLSDPLNFGNVMRPRNETITSPIFLPPPPQAAPPPQQPGPDLRPPLGSFQR